MQLLKRNIDSLATDHAGGATTGMGSLRRQAPLLLTLLTFVLVAAAILIGLIVRDSMRRLTRDSLRSILTANVTALEMWLMDRRQEAKRMLAEAEVDEAAKQLLQSHADQSQLVIADVKADAAYRKLATRMPTANAESIYVGWALLDVQGRVIASGHDDLIGQTLPIASDSLDKIITQSTTVCRPLRSPVALSSDGPLSRRGGAVMCTMAPISNGGRAEGSLALMLDPLAQFTELLSVARTGGTGETYAFDRQGTLLSQSRFEDQLRAAGLLDSDPLITSPLNVVIRDPGVNLTTGSRTDVPREQQPLTLMADQATRGAKGDNVVGYNDYRGVPVIGAWQWLGDYGIGITTEIDVAEAYAPMRLLQQSFLVLIGLVALTGLGTLIFASNLRRLDNRLRLVDRNSRRLGQYKLEELVGRGGMGSVYRGRHDVLRRDVAVKVLEGKAVNPQSITRFEREVRLTASLRHPNTIAIYDYGRTRDGTFFYVMEFVDGITIQDLVDDFGRQPPQRVIYLLLQICGSLSEAHQQGLVHRDIKPANILLTARAGLYDMIKVLDFGLVKEIDRVTVELTQSDAITGTPMYMSPESVRDAATADERSDLYSIGAVAYTLLTGLPTFDGDASIDICLKQLNEDPIRPAERIGQPLPEDLQNVLMSCLRKDPDERPRSVQDFADALRQCKDAYGWSAADAYRWWHEVFDDSKDGTNADPAKQEASPGKGRQVDENSQAQNQDTAR